MIAEPSLLGSPPWMGHTEFQRHERTVTLWEFETELDAKKHGARLVGGLSLGACGRRGRAPGDLPRRDAVATSLRPTPCF